MTELEALWRVAEAASAVFARLDLSSSTPWELHALRAALDALPAPAAEPEGKVVEVRAGVYHHRETETFSVSGVRWADGNCSVAPSSELIAIIRGRVRVPLPRVPELVGEVEP